MSMQDNRLAPGHPKQWVQIAAMEERRRWYSQRLAEDDNAAPYPIPTNAPIRERILALYRQQGRPQAHLDRVMRLVGGESPSMRSYGTKLESRFPSGVKQDWSSYL